MLTSFFPFPDTAVFSSALASLGSNIAEAVVSAGLPETSVSSFITALTSENETALALVPGTNAQIIGAGVGAFSDTYSTAFRNVWVSAVGFVALAAIGTLLATSPSFFFLSSLRLTEILTLLASAACFLFDPRQEFNNHIDAPVEKEDELYSEKEIV